MGRTPYLPMPPSFQHVDCSKVLSTLEKPVLSETFSLEPVIGLGAGNQLRNNVRSERQYVLRTEMVLFDVNSSEKLLHEVMGWNETLPVVLMT